MLGSEEDPLRRLCPLAILLSRTSHLPQKVKKPATANMFSTTNNFHLLIIKAIKDNRNLIWILNKTQMNNLTRAEDTLKEYTYQS